MVTAFLQEPANRGKVAVLVTIDHELADELADRNAVHVCAKTAIKTRLASRFQMRLNHNVGSIQDLCPLFEVNHGKKEISRNFLRRTSDRSRRVERPRLQETRKSSRLRSGGRPVLAVSLKLFDKTKEKKEDRYR